MKSQLCFYSVEVVRRSREGAWIEMSTTTISNGHAFVAPARERGLKLRCSAVPSRSDNVAPARERGLKSAVVKIIKITGTVAPARERGLKLPLS